jgi:hypothetical protein
MFVAVGSCNPNGLYSHTVPAATLLAAVVGAIAFLATGQRATGVLAAVLVLAHIPLDFVTGYKLFWPGGEIRGLRLYDWPTVDFALETALVAAGWSVLRSRQWAPRWAIGWRALVFLLVLQGTVDAVGKLRGGLKPSACARGPVIRD